jgi:hypothetical protein
MNRDKKMKIAALVIVVVITGFFVYRKLTITAIHSSANADHLYPVEVERANKVGSWSGSQQFSVTAEPLVDGSVNFLCSIEESETYAELFEFPRIIRIALLIDGSQVLSETVEIPSGAILPEPICSFHVQDIDGKAIAGKHSAKLKVEIGIGTLNIWSPYAVITSKHVSISI